MTFAFGDIEGKILDGHQGAELLADIANRQKRTLFTGCHLLRPAPLYHYHSRTKGLPSVTEENPARSLRPRQDLIQGGNTNLPVP